MDSRSDLPLNGLHHRSTKQPQHHLLNNDSSHAPSNNRRYNTNISRPNHLTNGNRSNSNNGIHPRNHYRLPRRIRVTAILKISIFICIAAYFGFLIRSTFWLVEQHEQQLHQQEEQQRNQHTQKYNPLSSFSSTTSTSTSSAGTIQQDRVLRRDARLKRDLRKQQRQERTRPTSTSGSGSSTSSGDKERSALSESSSWYSWQRQTDKTRVSPPQATTPEETAVIAATLDQLCGEQAQTAAAAAAVSQSSSLHYPVSTALNEQARVMITGILTPLGMQLAMYLHQECNVHIIGGMDAMFPNTVQHRLEWQERIQLLTTSIPKLIKPIALPYIGLDPKQRKKQQSSSDEFDIMSVNPTHIVHLAGYTEEIYADDAASSMNPEWRNVDHPYATDEYAPPLYPIRSSMVSMEQILHSLAQIHPATEPRPQLIYATTRLETVDPPMVSSIQQTTKQMDEILADYYYETYGIVSTAIRLPNAIYGPWGQPGTVLHELMMELVASRDEWKNTTTPTQPEQLPPNLMNIFEKKASQWADVVYSEDVVEALVGILQYKPTESTTVDLTTSTLTLLPSIGSAITTTLLPAGGVGDRSNAPLWNDLIHQRQQPQQWQQSQRQPIHQQYRSWTPGTNLRAGIVKTIAWYLDQESPFGPAAETGDEFLRRQELHTCAPDDLLCHQSSRTYLPCLSECNTRDQCLPSIFDDVQEQMIAATEGCDIVLYTESLGYDVDDLPLHAEYMDDLNLKDNETLVCNMAIVPRDSTVVKTVVGKVPDDQLVKFGMSEANLNKEDNSTLSSLELSLLAEQKLEALNGRLLYKGWILVWVTDALEPLEGPEASLMKLSPGKFFAPEVKQALYVEENFSVSPNIEDVLFLVGEMRRKPLTQRTVKKDIMVKNAFGSEIPKRVKYRLPEEPKRQAALLFAPLRIPNIDDASTARYRNGEKKLSVHDATKFMRYEVGMDPTEKEPVEIRRQREFYERIPSYINRNTELRSNCEPWYRYSMRHWVRTRWVVHDLNLEDSRLLRCDWYQEHANWGTDVDQLSFAHVMAAREVKRRISHKEPDDRVTTWIEDHPNLRDLTDYYEWHPLETEHNKLYHEPITWDANVPEHVAPDDKKGDEAIIEDDAHLPPALFVRIMSERIMALSRKIWSKHHKKKQPPNRK